MPRGGEDALRCATPLLLRVRFLATHEFASHAQIASSDLDASVLHSAQATRERGDSRLVMGRESVREARATGRTGPPRRRLIARSQIYAWPLF